MKTGIELIAQERQEQIEKHGYRPDRDLDYSELELVDFAVSVIDLNVNRYPFNPTLFTHIRRKSYKERLVIAGALIAAEIDRLQATEVTHD